MTDLNIDLNTSENPDYQLCKISGNIDMQSSMELETFSQQLVKHDTCRLLLDFSELEYINSQGMGILLSMENKLDKKGGGIIIIGAKERVREVFELTGINQAISMYHDLRTALNEDPLFQQ